jgi:hypothetical protein
VATASGTVMASYDSGHHRVTAIVPDDSKDLELTVTY